MGICSGCCLGGGACCCELTPCSDKGSGGDSCWGTVQIDTYRYQLKYMFSNYVSTHFPSKLSLTADCENLMRMWPDSVRPFLNG